MPQSGAWVALSLEDDLVAQEDSNVLFVKECYASWVAEQACFGGFNREARHVRVAFVGVLVLLFGRWTLIGFSAGVTLGLQNLGIVGFEAFFLVIIALYVDWLTAINTIYSFAYFVLD
jgi:hypothetical protein